MPIHALRIANFKGIDAQQDFVIKPITLFIGPNSSGKSSCIHALGSLAQTVKIGVSSNALVLDDEFAQLHLGRYIEVVHSRSYSDSMSIGVSLGSAVTRTMAKRANLSVGGLVGAEYCFRSTKKTQEIYLERARLYADTWHTDIKRSGARYQAFPSNTTSSIEAFSYGGFQFGVMSDYRMSDDDQVAAMLTAQTGRLITGELRRVLYLGPFRQPPLRRYPNRGSSPTEVGALGESSVTLLANELIRSSRGRPRLTQVSEWLSMMGLAKTIEMSRLGSSDLFDVNVKLKDDASLPIADLGYGLSQVLPVLVQCSFAPFESTLLFEQPELHLHSGAAKMLAKVFVDTVKAKGAHIIAETHSPDLFKQLMQELRDGNITLDQIVAYKVRRENGHSVFDKIQIEHDEGAYEIYDPWSDQIDKP